MNAMKEASVETMEDLGWHDLDSKVNCKITNDTTKRKLMVLINHISKKGDDCEKI